MPLAAEPSYGPFSGPYSEVGNHVGHAIVVDLIITFVLSIIHHLVHHSYNLLVAPTTALNKLTNLVPSYTESSDIL